MTKQPVDDFAVQKGFLSAPQPDGVRWDVLTDCRGQNGRYRKVVAMPSQAYRYRILAEGYEPAVSEPIPFAEGEVTIDFELAPKRRASVLPTPGGGGSPFAPKPPTAAAREKTPADEVPATWQLNVFTFVNGKASSYAEIVSAALPAIAEKKVRIAVDERTNTLVANGPKEDLAVLEALLLRFDTMATPKPK